MAHPLVVHCKRAEYDIYIGRGPNSRWGNPFRIGPDGDRDQVIERYRLWLPHQPTLLAALGGLAGKRLGCWCAPRRCHGDLLASVAPRVAGLDINDIARLLDQFSFTPPLSG